MANSGLILCNVEMSNLLTDLEDNRRQELRNSPLMPSTLLQFQRDSEGEEFLLQKASTPVHIANVIPLVVHPWVKDNLDIGTHIKFPKLLTLSVSILQRLLILQGMMTL